MIIVILCYIHTVFNYIILCRSLFRITVFNSLFYFKEFSHVRKSSSDTVSVDQPVELMSIFRSNWCFVAYTCIYTSLRDVNKRYKWSGNFLFSPTKYEDSDNVDGFQQTIMYARFTIWKYILLSLFDCEIVINFHLIHNQSNFFRIT